MQTSMTHKGGEIRKKEHVSHCKGIWDHCCIFLQMEKFFFSDTEVISPQIVYLYFRVLEVSCSGI